MKHDIDAFVSILKRCFARDFLAATGLLTWAIGFVLHVYILLAYSSSEVPLSAGPLPPDAVMGVHALLTLGSALSIYRLFVRYPAVLLTAANGVSMSYCFVHWAYHPYNLIAIGLSLYAHANAIGLAVALAASRAGGFSPAHRRTIVALSCVILLCGDIAALAYYDNYVVAHVGHGVPTEDVSYGAALRGAMALWATNGILVAWFYMLLPMGRRGARSHRGASSAPR